MACMYTPGPWRLDANAGEIKTTNRGLVMRLSGSWRDLDQRLADATLLAAAPELLEALTDLLMVIEHEELIPESLSYMRQARAAVAKALGQP